LDIVIEGIDRNGNFFGTVLHPSGNIAVELLKNGFARLVDWSAAFTTKERREAMKNAEREAKMQRKNIWQSYVPPAVSAGSSGTFEGTVVEVLSGDQVIVLVKNADGTSEERRIAFSSTRAPRPGNPR
jgi:staphylococcal nuclease domain-containing protein 1